MNREQKITYVNDLKSFIAANEGIFVYHYEGITVKDLQKLRTKMRESGAFLKITKNKITKIALKDSKAEKLEKFFKGPTAIACSQDPITLAKTLVNFSKSNEKLKILGGLMNERLLEPTDVINIAALPTLNEARAKIVGILAAPAQKNVSILLAPSIKIVYLVHAKNFKNLTH
jgi:large subunit ribosomal protein L10